MGKLSIPSAFLKEESGRGLRKAGSRSTSNLNLSGARQHISSREVRVQNPRPRSLAGFVSPGEEKNSIEGFRRECGSGVREGLAHWEGRMDLPNEDVEVSSLSTEAIYAEFQVKATNSTDDFFPPEVRLAEKRESWRTGGVSFLPWRKKLGQETGGGEWRRDSNRTG